MRVRLKSRLIKWIQGTSTTIDHSSPLGHGLGNMQGDWETSSGAIIEVKGTKCILPDGQEGAIRVANGFVFLTVNEDGIQCLF